jgi:quinol monooxygenase YgiN
MRSTQEFRLIVDIRVRVAAEIAHVQDALARMRVVCLSEPGCLVWEAYQSHETPERFFLVEHWASKLLWEAHGEMSAIQDIYLPEILPRINREIHPCRSMGHSSS